jgi:hypothetical protein
MMGLSSLVTLYYAAQTKRKSDSARDPGTLPPAAIEQLKARMSKFSDVVSLNLTKMADVPDVLCVERATFVAETRFPGLRDDKPFDVTEQICALLDPCSGVLRLSQFVYPAALFQWGQRRLELQIRKLPSNIANIKSLNPFCTGLGELGVIDTNWCRSNMPFTFLKLPEWMQAELVSLMGSSMDHTPFYRFPFMAALRTYLDVLVKETRAVAERPGQGLLKTLFRWNATTTFRALAINSQRVASFFLAMRLLPTLWEQPS